MAEEQNSQSVHYPNQSDNAERALASIAGILRESENLLPIIRREFRGEALTQYDNGEVEYIQVSKPLFVKIDEKTKEPLKITRVYKGQEARAVYIPHDEAIEEILSMLKFMGLNNICRMTNISPANILDDLREFECKLAAVLALKRQSWGLDKAMLPMIMTKIKTIVQDARYMAANGGTIKAIQKTVSRVETFYEGDKGGKKGGGGIYG